MSSLQVSRLFITTHIPPDHNVARALTGKDDINCIYIYIAKVVYCIHKSEATPSRKKFTRNAIWGDDLRRVRNPICSVLRYGERCREIPSYYLLPRGAGPDRGNSY